MKIFRFLFAMLGSFFLCIGLGHAQGVETPMTTVAAIQKNIKVKKTLKTKRLVPDFSLGQQEAHFTNLDQYIKQHLVYPENAQAYAVEGTVTVQIKGTSEGEIKDVEILNPLGYGCDEAVIELLKAMPNWIPAYNYGVPVNWKQIVQFEFSLR